MPSSGVAVLGHALQMPASGLDGEVPVDLLDIFGKWFTSRSPGTARIGEIFDDILLRNMICPEVEIPDLRKSARPLEQVK